MTKIKSCLLCKNYKDNPLECEHCEDWDNFCISESGKALREKIYSGGYQDGYDKGHVDAQRPQGEWKSLMWVSGEIIGECPFCDGEQVAENYCSYCGARLHGRN